MKNLITCFIFVVISPLVVFSQEPDKNLHEKCIYPSVLITPLDEGGRGSGFIVYSKKIDDKYHNVAVTCAHVVLKAGPLLKVKIPQYTNWSEFKGYQEEKGVVIGYDVPKDTALIAFLSDNPMPVVELDEEPKLFMGSKVLKTGYGFTDQPRIDRGEMVTLKIGGRENFRINAFTIYGDSGGPIFKDYKVIGIISQVARMENIPLPKIAMGVPISELRNLTSQENNNLGFIYNKDSNPNMIPFKRLKLDVENDPETFWSKPLCTHLHSS